MITILLLSHNNPAHLKRALAYYKQIAFKGRILIADSSRDELKQEVRDIVAQVEERLFAPVLLEYDPTLFLSEKIARASQEVATPYALLAGVDDFFSAQFMYEAMWFLKNNPDYLFVYGKMYGFTLYEGKVSCYYTGHFDRPKSFENQDPLERLVQFFPRYSACFNAVICTEGLQKTSAKTVQFLKQLLTSENLYIMLLLLEGKAKYIPKPFHWRELSEGSDGTTLQEAWLKDEHFKTDFQEMKSCLAQVLVEKNLIAQKDAEGKSSQLIDTFFAARYALTFPKEGSYKRGIVQYVPAQLLHGLRNLKASIKNSFIDGGEKYLNDEKSFYKEEYEYMKRLIEASEIQSYRPGLENVKRV